MCFVQERCALLEENSRLRDGFSSGIWPEEDDLMRLQMETLLAEKSRLAMENANLKRGNQPVLTPACRVPPTHLPRFISSSVGMGLRFLFSRLIR
ncbi:hypothetical protein LINPERPRIM_LOCUS11018 [Linum perenne]